LNKAEEKHEVWFMAGRHSKLPAMLEEVKCMKCLELYRFAGSETDEYLVFTCPGCGHSMLLKLGRGKGGRKETRHRGHLKERE